MMTHKIEWLNRPGTVGETWSPVTGCTPISEGCAHCWAKRMAKRLAGRWGYPEAPHEFDVTLHPDKLEEPLRWKKPRTVFVVSMGDLFHEDVPREWIESVLSVCAQADRKHTFMFLTKRPERMLEIMLEWQEAQGHLPGNWWGLVTAENQQRADERIPLLLKCPFAVRGVSIEPMLGPVDTLPFPYETDSGGFSPQGYPLDVTVPGLDWVIVGPETGPGARDMAPNWARKVRDDCVAADVPFFYKRGLLDGQEWHQWPK